LAASPTAEHAATLLDGHARLREASAFIAGTVPHREKHGGGRIAYDRWGPRVRKFFYLDSNSWIVTGVCRSAMSQGGLCRRKEQLYPL